MKLEPAYWAEPTGKFAAIPAHARMDVDLPIYTVPLYAIPECYKLVPVEPTEAMIQAMVKAVYGPATFKVTPATVEMENMRDAYEAMIEGEQ